MSTINGLWWSSWSTSFPPTTTTSSYVASSASTYAVLGAVLGSIGGLILLALIFLLVCRFSTTCRKITSQMPMQNKQPVIPQNVIITNSNDQTSNNSSFYFPKPMTWYNDEPVKVNVAPGFTITNTATKYKSGKSGKPGKPGKPLTQPMQATIVTGAPAGVGIRYLGDMRPDLTYSGYSSKGPTCSRCQNSRWN